ncbi:DUF4097 family beta strand repeat-containing protein [Candidatus Latescibacterota bacterium]
MKRNVKICLILTLLSIVFLSQDAFSDAEEEFHQTYTVDAGTEINVHNVSGRIRVIGWDEDYVDVYALLRTKYDRDELDLVTIDVTTNGVMEITTLMEKRKEEDTFFGRLFGSIYRRTARVNVEYTIKLPKSVTLASATNTNGNVEVDGTSGDSYLKTTNGSVEAENTDGFIEAKTTNGNISITNGAVARSAKTTNGSIRASISDNFFDETDFSTTNGSIDLLVPKDIDADIELKTVNGGISLDGIRLLVENMSKRNVTGSLGSGGKKIYVRTINGGITLQED